MCVCIRLDASCRGLFPEPGAEIGNIPVIPGLPGSEKPSSVSSPDAPSMNWRGGVGWGVLSLRVCVRDIKLLGREPAFQNADIENI